jgi:hypothetical protein
LIVPSSLPTEGGSPLTFVLLGAAAGALLLGASLLVPRLVARRQLRTLAGAVAQMRRLAGQGFTYRPVIGREAPAGAEGGHFEAATRDLARHALVLLGDRVEQQADGATSGVTRWFADASGELCGWFGVVGRGGKGGGMLKPVMMLFSESDADEYFVTGGGAPGLSLAQPPTVHRQDFPWADGVGAFLARHREGAAAASGLRHVTGIEDAVALVKRLRDHAARWRAAQAPAVLLEGDLRAVLQDRYDDLGPGLLAILSARGA